MAYSLPGNAEVTFELVCTSMDSSSALICVDGNILLVYGHEEDHEKVTKILKQIEKVRETQ